jgi:lipopolysaccharide biosynthesis protein
MSLDGRRAPNDDRTSPAVPTDRKPTETEPARPKVVAFYLPQFHPIPENDEWWGPGFTEWRNVALARPLFRGHRQPHLPADLGFYDLRVPEVREAQAELALAHGISTFCYYHYWFGGRRLLGRPFDEVLASGTPGIGFCLCWANEPWTRAWDGQNRSILIDQCYSAADDLRHIQWMAPALSDPRYLRLDGRAVVLVYRASQLPDPARTADTWREEARRLGVGELLLCHVEAFPEDRGHPATVGFDAAVEFQPSWGDLGTRPHQRWWWRLARRAKIGPAAYRQHFVYDYDQVVERAQRRPEPTYRRFPCVTPSWDNSPRRSSGAVILRDPSPEHYESWLRDAVLRAARQGGESLVFINAWNEWGEGSHLEPDRSSGRAYLEATRRVVGPATPAVPTGLPTIEVPAGLPR